MDRDLITAVLESGAPDAVEALLEAEQTVFWVDWRDEDESIAGYCEEILQTGSLAAELVENNTDERGELLFLYRHKREKVPLTFSRQDRHITLYALNRILEPDYEIRFCIASAGSDTLAFLPLAAIDWLELEDQFGEVVDQHFCRIAETPNLFTESKKFGGEV